MVLQETFPLEPLAGEQYWSIFVANLVEHVALRLGRDVESLDADADARRVVEQVANPTVSTLKMPLVTLKTTIVSWQKPL